MDDFILEEKIRETLKHRAEDVHEDAWERQRMQARVHQRLKEEHRMKQKGFKKIVIAAAAICVMGSITALGLGKTAVSVSHSSHDEIVSDYQQAVSMQKGYNSQVKTLERFSNGYEFSEAVPVYGEEQDQDGNTVNKTTSMSFTYRREGSQDVTYEGRVSTFSEEETPDAVLSLEDGTVLSYIKSSNKFVPVSYVPTEEEQKLAEEGKLNLAYGSEEVEEMSSSMVYWTENGIFYSLFTFDENMTSDELLQMAKELAESGS